MARDFWTLTEAARTEVGDPKRIGVAIGVGPGVPRFELYHFGFSICSQKVRTVLAEKRVSYRSNELRPTENYGPHYVRLRLFAAGPERMNRLAEGHTMRTSVATEGFDACVVPLLVDLEAERAVVDSAEILEYIERVVPEPELIPNDAGLAESVREQVQINDGMPHPGILYGVHAGDPRPRFMVEAMDGVYDRKRVLLERLIGENRDDPDLARAYRAKIAKEMAGKKLQKDPACMAGILREFAQSIAALDAQLAKHDGPWVCGARFTMGDSIWGVSLYRIQWLGHADLWNGYPRVDAYARRLYERPSLRSAVIEWPSDMPPSPHTAEVIGSHRSRAQGEGA